MTRTKSIYLALLAVLLSPMAANADPITWEVDIQLLDGGSVSGSFVYDALTGAFSDVMVSATGFPFPASSFALTSVLTDFSGPFTIDLVPSVADLTGLQDVYIALLDPMTDAGGTINIALLETYVCLDATCDLFEFFYSTDDFVGAATIRSVPEPGSLALISLGLLGMAAARRRRKV